MYSYARAFVTEEHTFHSPNSFAERTSAFDGAFLDGETNGEGDHQSLKESWLASPMGSYSARLPTIARIENNSFVTLTADKLSPTRKDPSQLQAQRSAKRADAEMSKGNWLRAVAEYEKALIIWTRLDERFQQARMLSDLGTANYELGDVERSLDNHQHALKLFQSISARSEEVRSLINLGSIYDSVGDSNGALESYQQALHLSREIHDQQAEAIVLESLGRSNELRGEFQVALRLFQQSLTISESIKDRQAQAYALLALGQLYSYLGERRLALDRLEQARTTAQELEARSAQLLEVSTLLAMGQVYRSSGDHERALDVLLSAITEGRSIRHAPHAGSITYDLALVYDELGERGKALTRYSQALKIAQRRNDASQQSEILNSLGQHYYSVGRLNQAKETLDRALARVRTIGDNSSEPDILYSLARVQREQGDLDSAKQLIEQSLSLTESLCANITSRNLRYSYFESVQEHYEFYIDLLMGLHQQRPHEGYDSLALSASERARSQDLVDWLIEARPTRSSAQVSTKFQALTSKEIQALLQDENVLLLEYSLGEKRSFLWLVSRDALKSYELPGRGAIEKLVGDFNRSLKQPVLDASYNDYLTNGTALSEVLLRPVQDQLGSKKLLIVADGSLQTIPFEALVSPSAAQSTREPLVVQHEIVNLPSATIFAGLGERSAKRQPATRLLAVLADPVFDQHDPRVSQVQTTKAEHFASTFPRLGGARWEAERIMALSSGSGKAVFGFEANRDAVMDGSLNDYQIVHFATHGLLNTRPNDSGIVLSLVDQKGKSRNGLLSSDDIAKLRVSADLVVLSSCITTKDEGMIGMTNSFLHAGAQSVVASLWNVDDIATADLMTRFYKGMLHYGLTPAAALREAQMEMRQEPQWRHPYYWAAFTVQGNSDFTVHPKQTKSHLAALIVIILPMGISFIALGIAFQLKRNRPESRSLAPSFKKAESCING